MLFCWKKKPWERERDLLKVSWIGFQICLLSKTESIWNDSCTHHYLLLNYYTLLSWIGQGWRVYLRYCHLIRRPVVSGSFRVNYSLVLNVIFCSVDPWNYSRDSVLVFLFFIFMFDFKVTRSINRTQANLVGWLVGWYHEGGLLEMMTGPNISIYFKLLFYTLRRKNNSLIAFSFASG